MIKDIFPTLKKLMHDLPISVNDRVIVRNREDFFSRNAKFRENKALTKISELTLCLLYANSKDADQSVHQCSLISAFVIRVLKSRIR